MRHGKILTITALIIVTAMLSSCLKLSEVQPPSSDYMNYTPAGDYVSPTPSASAGSDPSPTESSDTNESESIEESSTGALESSTETSSETIVETTEATTAAITTESTTEPTTTATETPTEATVVTPEPEPEPEPTVPSDQASRAIDSFSASKHGYSVPPSQEVLDIFERYDVHAYGPAESKVLYLSFNAGYEYNNGMGRTLDILKYYGIQATFFVDGAFIRTQNDLTRRIVNEGHQVGNHTLGHIDLAALAESGNYEGIEAEIKGFEQLYESVVGSTLPKLYRPPASNWSERSFELVRRLGYRSYMYSYAYRDWEVNNQPEPNAALAKLKEQIFPGSLIMLHTVSETNASILEAFILDAFNQGYRFGQLPTA